MLSQLLQRLLRKAPLSGGARSTLVCPPALLPFAAPAAAGWSVGGRLLARGLAALPGRWRSARRGMARLDSVRGEFQHSLADIGTPQAGLLQGRVRIARSLRELWHLRPEVFKLVSLHFSQAEAQSRLELLNRHFPTRSPRSGFAPLAPLPAEADRR